jgi:hypothetical protein
MTAGLLLTAVAVLAQTASQWIDFRVYYLNIAVLDSNRHASIFGVLSILAQAVAAVAIGLHAATTRRMAGLFVAALIGVLVVPRALLAYVPSFQRYDVPILLVPLTFALVVLCISTFRDGRRVRFMVWASLALLGCSFVLHAVGPQADDVTRQWTAAYTWSFQLTGMLKHSAELGGWMLLATAMAAVLSPPTRDGLGRAATELLPAE